MKVNEKLVRARCKLLNIQPFFGSLLLQLTPQEDNWCPTAGTDGEYLYYNPDFIRQLSEDQLLGTLVHEVMHCALGHIWRIGKREKHRWNLASDFAINLLVQKNGFKLPDGALLDSQYYNMNSEEIYEKIKFKKIKLPLLGVLGKLGGSGQEGKDKKDGEGEGEGKGEGKDKKDAQGVGCGDKNCPCGNSHKYWGKIAKDPKKQKELENKWAGAITEASKTRGDTPAGLEHLVKALKPKENWKQILASYMSTSMADFDFMRRDRRTLDSIFYIPEIASEDKLENVVVAVDTSGSIPDDTLNKFISEVKNIFAFFPNAKGWFMDCDCEIGSVVELNRVGKVKIKGRGGTSHVPVFKEIKKRNWRPKVAIMLTDLYTEFPDKKPDFPVLWLVPKEDYYSTTKVPFGRIIKMQV